MSELYRFIHAEKANYPVVLLCRALKAARSSYSAWCDGEVARRAREAVDDALGQEITVPHVASRHAYGVPRIHAELRRLGQWVNRKLGARVMRERDIRGVIRRQRRSLNRSDAKAKPAPDLIGRDFHAERPGTKLVGDITCPPTAEGRLYLACWLERATREVIGYAMADHHRADLVVEILGPLGEGDRHPDLARPGDRPRRGLHLHRDLRQPPSPAQAQSLRPPQPGRDQATTPTCPCGISITCPDHGEASPFRSLVEVLRGAVPRRAWCYLLSQRSGPNTS
ncbi:hypothetical protein GCM10010329_34810 [Streptomyces spiroverticillatus]|uniref:HTH-like domain-containing protein n=1 Tax=Streptomyces finlayi TaxID=67296 RepID=A0A919C9Y2_9ACTN|nr:IS3 family transposase [Streptomyces finlayi]GHA08994.1 hypothetical protein GCM10010329_34810 [Streptomyces spiroverticillatus]GHC91805.1 hypothetical protein GCM10010334_27220 [Streptomyces finlayi]